MRRTQKVLNVRMLLGTVMALAALGIAAYFWRSYQMQRTASALTERAEALAKENHFTAAAGYYARYLELCPEDANSRLRLAELSEQSTGGRAGERLIELYREALKPARQGLTPEKQLQAQRRLTELLQQTGAFDAAKFEWENLQDLEQKKLLPQKPDEWRWPGLKALTLAGKFREKNSGQSPVKAEELKKASEELDEAFRDVLEPEKAGKPKVFVDPEVYLARYRYHLQQGLLKDAQDTKTAEAHLKAYEAASGDLNAAVKLAPNNYLVLLTAAAAAQGEGAAATAVQREATPAAAQSENRQNAREYYANACDYYERAIKAAPTDQRAYLELGRLYESLGKGNLDRAVQTWRRGLKEVKAESEGIELSLALTDALIQQGRLAEAGNVLKNLVEVLAKLDPKSRLLLQRLVDLRSGKLAYLRGDYKGAIGLVTDLATGKEVVEGGSRKTTPQVIYEALIVMGQSHAAIAKDPTTKHTAAVEHSDQALTAFEQAALLAPQEAFPRLAAAETCKTSGRLDAAIANYQKALEIVSAMKPPQEAQRQAIYEALIGLLQQQGRKAEVDHYQALRREQMAESAGLTLRGVLQAIQDGKLDEALAAAQRGVLSRPEDPMAYLALGQAHQANKQNVQATDAYHTAFEKAKDAPAMQMQLVEYLLQSGDPSNAAEAEKTLRGLLVRHAPACLRLVEFLEQRENHDEALSVAQSGVKSLPKDPVAYIALGIALWDKKLIADAETAFKKAVALAPDGTGPVKALLGFYAGTGRKELARDTLEEMLRRTKLSEIDRELLRADILARLGDRKDAKDAYGKAIEAANEDPAVQMRLAEFLLSNNDPADDVEAERVLRRIMRQHDPARRRLAKVLINRGGEPEWEEAQKLLELSAGDPASVEDRFTQARSMTLRGGAENLAKAADICQDLLKEARLPVPAVCLLLAQIRERQDNLDDARKQYRTLADQEHPAPIQLASYVAFLLRRGPAEEADQRLKQLEKLAPEDLATVQLRARWLRDQKRIAEIEPLVEGVAQKLLERVGKDNPRQEAQLSRAIGDLYQRIEQYPAAERWYRQMLKLDPEAYEPLAISLGKQGRIQEAIALCDEAGKSDTSVRPAVAATAALEAGWATIQDQASADAYLKKVLEARKDQPDLLANVAGIRVLQGRSGEAIELFRQIQAQQPKNVEVLNNLATLLAEQPEPEKRKEALEFIDQAIKLAGPQPRLLDTKGMVLFFDGKPDEAMPLLQEAAQSPIPDPRFGFHLAVACGQLGQLDKARAALQQARAADLDHQLLTKADRQLLVKLDKKLGKP
ncbi:MAG: tetratricopeptide repeat protein [Thermoguttaceae bacterium]